MVVAINPANAVVNHVLEPIKRSLSSIVNRRWSFLPNVYPSGYAFRFRSSLIYVPARLSTPSGLAVVVARTLISAIA